jgi:hypothetical protein
MAEPNPTMMIADCIEKSKATTDQELIGEYIAETLGVLQTDNTEEDAGTGQLSRDHQSKYSYV